MDAVVDRQEQYLRRNCLLVHRIVQETVEDKDERIIIKPDDIDGSNSLDKCKSSKSAKSRPIIVKFVRYNTRNRIYRNKKKLKGTGISVVESLTANGISMFEKTFFEYLKNYIPLMDLCFFKRRTSPYMVKKDDRMSLKKNFFLTSAQQLLRSGYWFHNGRILILDGQVDDAAFLLTDLYNANNECEQLNVLTTLCNFLSNITYLHCKNITFGRNFNVFFDTNYEAPGGNPKHPKKCIIGASGTLFFTIKGYLQTLKSLSHTHAQTHKYLTGVDFESKATYIDKYINTKIKTYKDRITTKFYNKIGFKEVPGEKYHINVYQ